MASNIDWRHDITARAKAAGVTLPEATIEEMAEHLDEIYTAAVRDGASDRDAQRRAQAALDESALDVLRVRSARAASESASPFVAPAPNGGRHLNVAGAIRLAIRQLRLRPGFATITILVLALGIGASTTVFTVVDSVLLRPLPYADPDRLVTLWDSHPRRASPKELLSPVTFMDYRSLPEFEGAAAWHRPSINLADPGLDPLRVNTIEVSGNLFDVLGVRPQIGEGAVRHRHLGAGGYRQRNVPESSSRQRPPGDRPTPDDQRPDRRSARQEPHGGVSTASIERQPAAGCVRGRRRRQGHTKRAARSGCGTDRLFQREAVSLSRDVSDRARDGHRYRRTGDPPGVDRRLAQHADGQGAHVG